MLAVTTIYKKPDNCRFKIKGVLKSNATEGMGRELAKM
jgi:hypothetical protein